MADIVSRIRKMLELSRKNNSPEEAASAAAMAQELMFKYQISEADITIEERVAEDVVDDEIGGDDKVKKDVWKASLANSIAKAFGCKMYTWRDYAGGTNKVSYKVVGIKSVVQTVSYMFGYLSAEIDRLAEEAWKAAKACGERTNGRTWKNSFRLGAVNTVYSRLKQKADEQEQQIAAMAKAAREAKDSKKSMALALYKSDQERVEGEYKNIYKARGLRQGRSVIRRHSVSAYQQGQTAGSRVSLGGGKGLGTPASQIRD
jgi:hypothetical protein